MHLLKNLQRGLIFSSLISMGLLGTVSITRALDVGDMAPDFSLPATTGGKISLSQYRGKRIVLLEFYGADFSPV